MSVASCSCDGQGALSNAWGSSGIRCAEGQSKCAEARTLYQGSVGGTKGDAGLDSSSQRALAIYGRYRLLLVLGLNCSRRFCTLRVSFFQSHTRSKRFVLWNEDDSCCLKCVLNLSNRIHSRSRTILEPANRVGRQIRHFRKITDPPAESRSRRSNL